MQNNGTEKSLDIALYRYSEPREPFGRLKSNLNQLYFVQLGLCIHSTTHQSQFYTFFCFVHLSIVFLAILLTSYTLETMTIRTAPFSCRECFLFRLICFTRSRDINIFLFILYTKHGIAFSYVFVHIYLLEMLTTASPPSRPTRSSLSR